MKTMIMDIVRERANFRIRSPDPGECCSGPSKPSERIFPAP